MARLPRPRGPISDALIATLRRSPYELPLLPRLDRIACPEADDDLQLALSCCYELGRRGFDEVDERWESAPGLLAVRAALEVPFEAAVEELVPPEPFEGDLAALGLALCEIAEAGDGAALARYAEMRASEEQVLELLVHRTAHPAWNGERRFADSLRAVGLDPAHGAYLDLLPAATLATINMKSLFGRHRRLRGVSVGCSALLEMTSAAPKHRYALGLRRLGFDAPEATRFFDEPVDAAGREQAAAVELARREPELAGQIVWGARALAALERRWSEHVLAAWEDDRSSLRHPLPAVRVRSMAPVEVLGGPAAVEP